MSAPPLVRLQESYDTLLGNKHASSLDELFSIRGLLTAPLPQDLVEGQESEPPSNKRKRCDSSTPLRVPHSPPYLNSPSTSPSTPLLPSPPSSPSRPASPGYSEGVDTVVLIGDVDDLEQPRRTGKRRRAATNSSTANDDKKYIRSVGHTVREITDFCTQMDHLETLPKGASDVSDLHASTLIQQALDGFDSDSGTDSGEEMNDGKFLKKLTNRRSGFPSQLHASDQQLMPVHKVCPSDFLFFFTSKCPNANDYIDFEGRVSHFTTSSIRLSNDPFSAFIEPPSKKRKGGGGSSSSSSAIDKIDFDGEGYTAKEKAEITFLNGLPRDGAERASYYSDLIPNNHVYEESVHKVISSFIVVNPNSGGEEGDDEDEDEGAAEKGKGPKKKKKRKREIKKVQTLRWTFMLKKDVTKMAKQMSSYLVAKMNFCKKVAALCEKEVQRRNKEAARLQTKEAAARAKRISREVGQYWRKFEKEQRDAKKIAEKMEIERIKREEEVREAKRQQKKLNFLLTQTELFSHFISRKIQNDGPTLEQQKMIVVPQGEAATSEEIQENVELQEAAKRKAELAHEKHVEEMSNFDEGFQEQRQTNLIQTSTIKKKDTGKGDVAIHGSFDVSELEADALKIESPKLFQGKLREYQLRGLRWLVNVYNNGINGILADEMGLGKTIQSMSLLAHLAEEKGIWGPFLVVCPKSTLPNWQQEFQKFIPQFKVLPYWGSQNERKVLRSFWNPKRLYTPEASCHVLITSYGFAVKDVKHLQKIKWQYMVLDEAQALKSSQSQRWKTLLSYNARNRLLLTGTPIQNNMAELWALLHFIMPTIFDSHDEFNEWFSKDIESHAENQSGSLSDHQLSRLHTILKPFMLRRVKGDVENELAPKTEIDLYCELSARQRRFYQFVRRNVSIAEIGLLKSSMEKGRGRPSEVQMKRLMNLVMQFRKVCNHPDIFERNDVTSPFSFSPLKVDAGTTFSSPLSLSLPRLIYQEGLAYGGRERSLKGCRGSLRSSLTGLETPLSTFLVDRCLRLKLNIFCPDYIAGRVLEGGEITSPSSFQSASSFSFLRFSGTSIGEVDEMINSPYLAWFRWLSARNQRQRKSLVYGSSDKKGANFLEIEPKNSLFLLAEQKMGTLLEFFSDPHCERPPLIQSGETKYKDNLANLQLYGRVYVPKAIAPPIPLFSSLPGALSQQRFASRGAVCRATMFGVCLVPQLPSYEEICDPIVESNGVSSGEGEEGVKMKAATPTRGSTRLSRRGKGEERGGEERGSEPVVVNTPRVLNSLLVKNQEDWHSVSFGARRERVRGESERERWLQVETGDHFGEVDEVRKVMGEERGGEGAADLFERRSYLTVPSMEKLIRDCGKLRLLDSLLVDLKAGDHRVLVYSQMTKMLSILEDYMQYRKYSYVRLDGSTSLEERALMVNNFQKDTSIYVFLLSTRAGGLGINLTAADTVIFYDSDWNPTIDAQAMDRAHRLGQTRPVTVYRLISKGTVEERILQRAKQKNTIQNIVIAGGVGKQDMDDASSGDPGASEVMSLLLGDDELEEQLKKQQSERSHKRKRGGGAQGGAVSKKVKSFF